MGTDREREALEVVLREAVAGTGEYADVLATLVAPDPNKGSGSSTQVAVAVIDMVPKGDFHEIRLLRRSVCEGVLHEQHLEGQCRFESPRIAGGSLVLWVTAAEKPMEPRDRLSLRRWALLVGTALTLMATGGAASWYFALREAANAETTIVELLALTAAVGWTGACGAALRTVMERYRQGFEYDEYDGDQVVRRQWPPAPAGTERFSALIAPTCLGRPVLGLVIGPIAYFLTQSGASAVLGRSPTSEPDALALATAMAVSGLAGMFAKSIWDNLNERAQKLFK